MKLRKILAMLWMVLLLLTATSYAENTEDPIIADTPNGYIRLNIPYLKRVDYYGHSYIQCVFTNHSYVFIYGIPVVNEDGTTYVWIDPEANMATWLNWAVDPNEFIGKVHLGTITGDTLTVYDAARNMYPDLFNEVIAANRSANARYGNDIAQAQAAHDNENWQREYEYLKKVYDNGCHDQAIIRDLGAACWNLGDYDEATEWESQRIMTAPSSSAYNQRAWHYYLLGKNDLALEDAQQAVTKDENDSNILDTRGSIYYALGQYDKALEDFNKSLDLDDESAHTYYYRAKCYEALGKQNKAESDYKKARKYNANIIDDATKFEKQRRESAAIRKQHTNTNVGTPGVTNPPAINPAVTAPVNGNGPTLTSDGAIAVAPTTLPTDTSQEIYNLNDGVLKYYSQGRLYTLSYEDPMITYNALKAQNAQNKLEQIERPHGKYLFKQDYGYIWGDFSFDFDNDTKEYIIYDGEGIKEALRYDEINNAIVARDFVDSECSGVYAYDPSRDAYVLASKDYTIKPNTLTLVRHKNFEGDSEIGRLYKVENSNGVEYEVTLYPEKEVEVEAKPNLPAMWYKMTDVEYPSDWIAFTYDNAKNTFTMYHEYDSGDGSPISAYAHRRFRDANHIETVNIDSSNFGATDGVYVRNGDEYDLESGWDSIRSFITDGMFNFMYYVKNK